jgi:signal peptidase II
MVLLGRPRVLTLAAVVVVLDQATKAWAEHSLVLGQPQEFLGSFLRLHLIYNPGAAFSFLTSATWVFAIISSVFCVVMVALTPKLRHPWWQTTIGVLLGGAAGNLIDRLLNEPGFGQGHVVDFLELPYWPIFNVADIAVVIASCTMVVFSYFGPDYSDELKDSSANV